MPANHAEGDSHEVATAGQTVRQPVLVTVPEAATMLRLQRRFLDRAIGQGLIKVIRLGRAVRVPFTEIERVSREGLPSPAVHRSEKT